MEFMDALEEFSGTNDHSIIMKGKRTKRRQRPLSPVCRATAVTSSSSSGGDDQGGGRDGEVFGYIYSLIPSTTTMPASDLSISATSTDQEDEDMANCLILLAQGESFRKQVVDQDHEIKMKEKFTSRRFNEMVTSTTGGKVGFFVYECKTCNRTFPSFQALGGHRASHKKPKISIEENKATIVTPPNDHHHGEEEEEKVKKEEDAQAGTQLINNRLSPPLSIQSTNKSCTSSNKAAKSHECSICGAEFASGQALGGHMRRHRNPTTTTTTKVAMILETSPSSTDHHRDESSSHDIVQRPRNFFPLDLNLPAPSEDDLHRDLKFQLSANQQPHLVFSAPALVDCHY